MSDLNVETVLGAFRSINAEQLPHALAACVNGRDEASDEVLVLDLRDCKTAEDALTVLAKRLGFPDYFGGNLDALFDVVNERAFGEANVGLNQTWLIKTSAAQAVFEPIRDTLVDAMGDEVSACLTVLWLTL